MPYITKADVATFLNITLTANGEALVDSLIPAVEAYAKDYCNRTWNNGSIDIVETFDGFADTFFPKNAPIDAITGVTVNGQAIDTAYLYNYGTHIKLGAYATMLDYSYRPFGYRSVVITYRANSPLPADLKQALIQWAADIFKSSEDAGKTLTQVHVGTVRAYFTAQDGIPKFVEMVLNKYRAIPIYAL